MAAKGTFYVFACVSDLAQSKKFYGETLGWTLGTDEPDVAGFGFGSGYLVIHADDRPREARRYAGGMQVEVEVDDVDAEHARLVQLGVEVSACATSHGASATSPSPTPTATPGRTARPGASSGSGSHRRDRTSRVSLRNMRPARERYRTIALPSTIQTSSRHRHDGC